MIARILAAALLMLIASAAAAHAFLDHASPRVGSTVHGSPPAVKLWFTQELEPAFSTVRVLDQNGKQIDRGDARPDERDHAILQVSVPALAPGRYHVVWRVVSVDTHVTEGDFTFEVAP